MNGSAIKKDYRLTVLTGFFIGSGILVLNSVIARWKGLEFLGEYLFLRRLGYSSVGLLLLGTNISLPYYIPKIEGKNYIQYAIIVFIIVTIPLILILIFLARFIEISGFNTHNFFFYFIWFSALSLQYLNYSYLRGLLKIVQANFMQLLLSVILHALFLVLTDNIYHYVVYLSLSIIVISLLSIVTALSHNYSPKGFNFKETNFFVRFGAIRVPSQIAQLIIMNLFPILLITAVGYHDLAFFNSSLSILRLFWFIIGPLGMVMLPHLAKEFDSGENILNLKPGLDRMLLTLNTLSLSALILIVTWAAPFMNVWLDTDIFTAGNTLSILGLALPFYAFNGAVRSLVDAGSEYGWNSFIYGIAVIVMVLVWVVGNYLTENLLVLAAIGFVISQATAFVMNIYVIRIKLGLAINIEVDHVFTIYIAFIALINIHIMKYFKLSHITGLLLLSLAIILFLIFCIKFYPKLWFRHLISDIVNRGK